MLKQKIKAVQFVRDMASGLNDAALMAKYSLNERQLRPVFRELIDSQFIATEYLHTRALLSDTQITKAFLGKMEDIEVSE